jgi:ABC-2 type transport system permease protein
MAAPEPAPAPPAGLAATPHRYGEVYDRGYQHYDGPRLGRRHAIAALIRYSMKRALGIKKSWTSKVVPILLYLAVSVVVIVPIGIRAFLPSASVLEYWDFFGFIFALQGIFVATIAPEMLCGDRRENVLQLYFSRAITRLDYLIGKLAATAILTLTMSFVPAAIYWLGRQLLEDKPLSAIRHNADDLGRLAVVGILLACYLGAIGLTVSSFTGRKSIAVAIIVIGFLLSTTLAYALSAAVNNEDLRRFFVFLSPADTINEFVHVLFRQPSLTTSFGDPFNVSIYIAEMIAVIAACCGIMYWRYVPND